MADFDIQYLHAVRKAMNAPLTEDRTGTGTRKSVGVQLRASCKKSIMGPSLLVFPALSVRRVAPKIAFEELMWMMRGSTDVTELQDRGIHIWDGNSSREYLDRNGLAHLPTNSIGKSYGYQMRNFNGHDQLYEVYESLRDNPYGRRHLISFWNPAELHDMALAPCHYSYNFVVSQHGGMNEKKTLSLVVTMRSADAILGVPNNMMFASFWLHFFATALGYEPDEVVLNAADFHVYENHRVAVRKLQRRWEQCEKFLIQNTPTFQYYDGMGPRSLESVMALRWEDLVMDYEALERLPKDMLVMATG